MREHGPAAYLYSGQREQIGTGRENKGMAGEQKMAIKAAAFEFCSALR